MNVGGFFMIFMVLGNMKRVFFLKKEVFCML